MNNNNIRDFDSLEVENIPKEIKKSIMNTYRVQAYDSIMCGYFYIGFIDFILKSRSLIDFTNLLFYDEYEKKEVKIIPEYFQ